QPFMTQVNMYEEDGSSSGFHTHIDDRAMINVINAEAYHTASRRIGKLLPSTRVLRMADGSLVPSLCVWTGEIKWRTARTIVTFEVFPSGGSWKVLIGKPLLQQLHAVHDYTNDIISLPSTNPLNPGPIVILNIFSTPAARSKRPISRRATVSEELKSKEPTAKAASPHVMIVTIPPDVPSPDSFPSPLIQTNEQYIFRYDTDTGRTAITELSDQLSQAGVHIVLADRKPKLMPMNLPNAHHNSPCTPVLFMETTPSDNEVSEVPEFPLPSEDSC
ncbi:hypothetical protein C8R48DRAFT_605610, partial [Suillus tomentosus]